MKRKKEFKRYKIAINLDFQGEFLLFLKRNKFSYRRIQFSKFDVCWFVDVPAYYTKEMFLHLPYIKEINETRDDPLLSTWKKKDTSKQRVFS